jgi:hypothetical protein
VEDEEARTKRRKPMLELEVSCLPRHTEGKCRKTAKRKREKKNKKRIEGGFEPAPLVAKS